MLIFCCILLLLFSPADVWALKNACVLRGVSVLFAFLRKLGMGYLRCDWLPQSILKVSCQPQQCFWAGFGEHHCWHAKLPHHWSDSWLFPGDVNGSIEVTNRQTSHESIRWPWCLLCARSVRLDHWNAQMFSSTCPLEFRHWNKCHRMPLGTLIFAWSYFQWHHHPAQFHHQPMPSIGPSKTGVLRRVVHSCAVGEQPPKDSSVHRWQPSRPWKTNGDEYSEQKREPSHGCQRYKKTSFELPGWWIRVTGLAP